MLRRYMPKSLYARTVLIVILPIFLMQAFITYFFFDRHWDLVTDNLSANVAGQIAFITQEYAEASTEEEKTGLSDRANQDLQLSIRFEPDKIIPEKDRLSVYISYFFLFASVCLPRQGRFLFSG